MTGRGPFLQQPPMVLVYFRIWDGIWAAGTNGTNVGEKRRGKVWEARTSIQRGFRGYSGDKVVHNQSYEVGLAPAKGPSVVGSARPLVGCWRRAGNRSRTLS